MKNTNELHNSAMERAEFAIIARMNREYEDAERLFRESLDLELKAIASMEATSTVEPTYSILHRSAATLALDCNEPRFAEKLIGKALSKDPPAEIVEELRDLMEQVHFRRHLQLRGITLNEDEMQMSLAGQGVGYGVVHSAEFVHRVDIASKVIYRIVERHQNKPFRERGRMSKYVKDDYELFLSVPRAASFAITLKLGHPLAQPKLPGLEDVSIIVDEFMDLMDLINMAQHHEIEKRIPDPAYRTNFVQLAKRLAPDGENVKIVGFTSMRRGRERVVAITRQKPDFIPRIEVVSTTDALPEKVMIRGFLRFADAINLEKGQIGIVDEETHRVHPVKVPEGMMDDIVKPLWNSFVIIKGTRLGSYIMLEDIEEQ